MSNAKHRAPPCFPSDDISHDRLKELMKYDPITGLFTNRTNRCGRAMAGAIAGCANNEGYLSIYVDGKRYKSHRLAWFYVTGKFPNGEIDHINGDTSDNRFHNLREARRQENCMNKKIPTTNKSGKKGVYFDKESGKWRSSIQYKGKIYNLGRFESVEDAALAYEAAANMLFGEWKRGFGINCAVNV